MKGTKITLGYLAKENIKRKAIRSFGLIFLVMLFSLVLFAGTVFSLSLSSGVSSLSDRLGADIMVVPEGHEVHIDSILLSGEPSDFYLPKNTMDLLKDIEGIDKMSPQTYLATLSASCCSYPVQIIGIDFDTDFLIKPWLTETLGRELKKGEVIVGNHVSGDNGQKLSFFNQPFNIAGRLEQTGMAFDATVFMTKDTIIELAKAAQRIKEHPLSKDGSLISTVMIKLKPGYDAEKVSYEITHKLSDKGIYAMFSKKFVNSVSANLSIISKYIYATIIGLGVLAIFIISILFSVILHERKKEMAVLRTLGATKSRLRSLIMLEAFIISSVGSVLGTIFGGVIIVIMGPIMIDKLRIPYLAPSTTFMITVGAITLIIGALTGPLASLYSVIKLSKRDVYVSLREDS